MGTPRRPGPAAAVLAGAGLLLAAATAAAQTLPDTVRIGAPGLHPEGIEWDAPRERFLVGSITRGTVTAVRDDGSLDTLVADPAITSSIGIHVDRERGRLLVADADLAAVQGGGPGHARLGIYDLESGERIRHVDLGGLRPGGRHFANDLTSGPDGTVYVTDSFTPVVYRVPPDGEPAVLAEDTLLGHDRFGLNGIVRHPDGFLLAAVSGPRRLVRIPLDAPAELEEVTLSEPFAADGMVLAEDGTLVAVATTGSGEDQRSEVLRVRSSDGWVSAEIVGRAPAPGATTAALRDEAIYVVNPRFDAMGGPEPAASFPIYRVRP